MFKKDLGIVICNFNKIDYLRDCLKSISCANFDDLTYDIIVVDNASSDGSEQMIIEEFPDVILIPTGANLGGSGGFARGMQYVLDIKYKYLSVLDNDTKVDINAFIELKNYLDKNDEVGIVGATILKMDEPEIIQEIGAQLDFEEYGFILNYNDRKYDEKIPKIVQCDYVPACCFMTRYEIVEKVGVFDTSYFIYWDDIEWCTRVKNLGKQIHAISTSKVWHKGGAKLVTSTFPTYYFYRNLIRFFVKNLNHSDIPKFAEVIADKISKMFYFSTIKNEYNNIISLLSGITDAYSDKTGAQWNSIFDRNREENRFFTFCKNKNIALIEYKDILYFRGVVRNLISSNAKLTIFVEDISTSEVLNYFPNLIIKEIGTLDKTKFDFVVKAEKHIEYMLDNYDDEIFYLDPHGNFVMDKDSYNDVINFQGFRKIFMPVYAKLFEQQFKIMKDK